MNCHSILGVIIVPFATKAQQNELLLNPRLSSHRVAGFSPVPMGHGSLGLRIGCHPSGVCELGFKSPTKT